MILGLMEAFKIIYKSALQQILREKWRKLGREYCLSLRIEKICLYLSQFVKSLLTVFNWVDFGREELLRSEWVRMREVQKFSKRKWQWNYKKKTSLHFHLWICYQLKVSLIIWNLLLLLYNQLKYQSFQTIWLTICFTTFKKSSFFLKKSITFE